MKGLGHKLNYALNTFVKRTPALEDNQFRLATEEAVLKKSISIVDTGLSVEKKNIQDMNVDTLQ